jgi:hypothetical protein
VVQDDVRPCDYGHVVQEDVSVTGQDQCVMTFTGLPAIYHFMLKI